MTGPLSRSPSLRLAWSDDDERADDPTEEPEVFDEDFLRDTEEMHFPDILKDYYTLITQPTYTAAELQSALDSCPLPDASAHPPAIPVRDSAIPRMFAETFHLFTPSEVRLYSLAMRRTWSCEELKDVIRLLTDMTFDPRDIGPDIESRVSISFQFSYGIRMVFVYISYGFRTIGLKGLVSGAQLHGRRSICSTSQLAHSRGR